VDALDALHRQLRLPALLDAGYPIKDRILGDDPRCRPRSTVMLVGGRPAGWRPQGAHSAVLPVHAVPLAGQGGYHGRDRRQVYMAR
jgi:hypothetical protein